jgi:hypothetical protein
MLSEMKESFINLIDIERILMKRRIRRTLWAAMIQVFQN